MTTLARDTQRRAKKISRLEDEIARFDAVLDQIQKLMPEDLKVYDRLAEVRDAAFRLQQQMRGCEIVVFTSNGLDDVVYENAIADLVWDREKQNAYASEEDESLKGEDQM